MLPVTALGLGIIALTADRAAIAAPSTANRPAIAVPGIATHPKEGIATHPKRGIASARYESADPAKLRALGATWAYNWSATPPPPVRRLQWVPMVWGAGSVTRGTIATLTRARRTGRARYLLGFNEPDNGGQANMSPAQAAALWPELERTGLKLGSPATAVPTDGWLARFMAIAHRRHLRINFIALHYYQDFTDPNAVSRLRGQLISLHRQFGRPIWITELGALDISRWGEPMQHAPTRSSAVSYMRRVFAMLDRLQFVRRYAWFTDSCWSDPGCRESSLFDARGRITAIGRAFGSGA